MATERNYSTTGKKRGQGRMQRIYGAFLNDMRQRLADDKNTHGKIYKGLKGAAREE